MATFASVTITTPGTPQSLAALQAPLQPTISVQGNSYPIGGAQQPVQVVIQADPANVANVYIGARGMVRASRSGVGAMLVPGAFITLGNSGAAVVLDEVWADTDTAGNKLLLSMLG